MVWLQGEGGELFARAKDKNGQWAEKGIRMPLDAPFLQEALDRIKRNKAASPYAMYKILVEGAKHEARSKADESYKLEEYMIEGLDLTPENIVFYDDSTCIVWFEQQGRRLCAAAKEPGEKEYSKDCAYVDLTNEVLQSFVDKVRDDKEATVFKLFLILVEATILKSGAKPPLEEMMIN